MKFVEHPINQQKNFIMGWYPKNTSLCDELIDWHNNCPHKNIGVVGKDKKFIPEQKTSTETDFLKYSPEKLKDEYFMGFLQPFVDEYVKEWSFCNHFSAWRPSEGCNIQHYKPGEGFFAWHCERGTASFPISTRHLVFMTYLNDVDDGGETEWYYQKVKIKPQKGLTLIWPVDWTHTHRGLTSMTQEKYIITGWFNFQ